MRSFLAGALLFLTFVSSLAAQDDLTITKSDFFIDQKADGGFHLYIKKKPGIHSVLLTESTRDPSLRADNYAYRAAAWNDINGNELRYLDGEFLPRRSTNIYLVDSTPENHEKLGEAFHIFIPWILNYGYENGRHGEAYVTDGTFLNIRAFALPYADYRGAFKDNPFVLRVTQKPLEPPEENYMKETEEAFKEIAGDYLVFSKGPPDLVDKIRGILEKEAGRTVDIVLCLDTTSSMKDDIEAVRSMLIPALEEIISGFRSFRIGMVLYKDYYDEYLYKVIPFTADFSLFQRNLNAIKVRGGRDIPEAVYEALYQGAKKFPWNAESRLLILIGDAPPHPRQRGSISKEMVDAEVKKQGLQVHAIILPQ